MNSLYLQFTVVSVNYCFLTGNANRLLSLKLSWIKRKPWHYFNVEVMVNFLNFKLLGIDCSNSSRESRIEVRDCPCL